ncbi:hypothetical protein ABZ805_24655 [Saccharopolyspora sp. NPDC047091]|uniref:hypothetical protein n=1 Tax=Saccharopolyspora sp. NPDC047091 TaxID=3155924 RepID=UPI00340613DE
MTRSKAEVLMSLNNVDGFNMPERDSMDEFRVMSGRHEIPTEVNNIPETVQSTEGKDDVRIDDGVRSRGGELAAVGAGNAQASRDIDQSLFKGGDFRGASFFGLPDLGEVLARSGAEKRSGRGLQDPAALESLANMYVAPSGLLGLAAEGEPETAFQVLLNRRVLLLSSPVEESGQFSASLRLSQELRAINEQLNVREEFFDPEAGLAPQEFLVEGEPAVLVIDLRGSSEQDLKLVRRTLVGFIGKLEEYESYLVLILPLGRDREFEQLVPGRVRSLEKPLSIKVLSSHVGIDCQLELEDAPDVVGQLEEMWPPAISALAGAVRQDIDAGESLRQGILNELRQRNSFQPDTLRNVVGARQKEGDTEWIAMLIAAAVLEEAPLMHIVEAADELLAYSQVLPAEKLVPLLRPSPYSRLLRLAEADEGWFDLRGRTLRPQGFAIDVIQYFWSEHPDVREPVFEWLSELPRNMAGLSREALEKIADRAADLAMRNGFRIATSLASKWSKVDRQGSGSAEGVRYRRSVAVRLVTMTATDSAIGSDVRRQLWEWSRSSDSNLQLLAAEVCSGLGEHFPRNAFTRLKHLAKSGDEEVRRAVVYSVCQICTAVGLARGLRYLSEWFKGADDRRLCVLAESVSRMLKSLPWGSDVESAETFWRSALGAMPPDELRPLLKSWLEAAVEAPPEERESMVEPLVQATDRSSQRIAQLWYASRLQPAAAEEGRGEGIFAVVRLLWTRLDEIDPIWEQE